jgi:hypothetical protein
MFFPPGTATVKRAEHILEDLVYLVMPSDHGAERLRSNGVRMTLVRVRKHRISRIHRGSLDKAKNPPCERYLGRRVSFKAETSQESSLLLAPTSHSKSVRRNVSGKPTAFFPAAYRSGE